MRKLDNNKSNDLGRKTPKKVIVWTIGIHFGSLTFPSTCFCCHRVFLSTFSYAFYSTPESATFFARHSAWWYTPYNAAGIHTPWTRHWLHGEWIDSHFRLNLWLPKRRFGKVGRNFIPPKRRFWKEEQKKKSGWSKHFSRAWVLDLGYEPLKNASKIRISWIWVPPSIVAKKKKVALSALGRTWYQNHR